MKQKLFLTILLSSLLFSSCDTITGKKDDNNSASLIAAAALVSQTKTSTAASVKTINFNVVSGTTNVSCTGTIPGTVAGVTGATLNDLRFYVHDVKLISADGTKVDFTITTDNKWQLAAGTNTYGAYAGVALLDFEDKTNGCATTGTTDMNKSITGTSPVGNYVGVEFKLGVPFYLNHMNVSTATSPLNITEMYWAWASGYKFVKIEYTASSKNSFHLGSHTCTGNTAGHVNPCSQPNVPTITLTKATGFDATKDVVTLDINALYTGADASSTGINVCMAGNATSSPKTACEPMIKNIGLNFTTGATATTQTAFSLK